MKNAVILLTLFFLTACTPFTGNNVNEKVAQLFIISADKVNDETKDKIGGVILFAKDIKTPDQTKDFIAGLQKGRKTPLFIAVDEEGGKVSRIASNKDMGYTPIAPMGTIETADQAKMVGKNIGKMLKELGFNIDFAPVSDINTNPDNPVIGDRAFTGDVEGKVSAFVSGIQGMGVMAVLKHFPGLGNVTTDPHTDFSTTDVNINKLLEREFIPFKRGINEGVTGVMVGHVLLPNVTDDNLPATLSPQIIGLLRNELGFDGLIITDAMNMGAITKEYTSGEAAVLAIKAGCDIVLMPEDFDEAYNAVIEAVKTGEIPMKRIDDAYNRIIRYKGSLD